MKKLVANLSLVIITFFSAIQYVFLSGMPDDISPFLFLALTNAIGFLFLLVLFHKELPKLNKTMLLKSIVLSLELLGFNLFLLLGTRGNDPMVIACILSLYFVMIIPLQTIFGKRPSLAKAAGTVLVLLGLLVAIESRFALFTDIRILFLIIADLFFAIYILTVECFAKEENPALLSMGQSFFVGILTLILFFLNCLFGHTSLSIPTSFRFWGAVLYVGIFIRGIYSIVQITVQRYVSALNTSLIFSTEVLMTIFAAPLLGKIMQLSYAFVKPVHIVGGLLVVAGILMADGTVQDIWKRRFQHGNNNGE